MDLLNLLKVLFKKWWIVAIVTILTTIGAIFLTRFLEDSYKSTAMMATGFTTRNSMDLYEESANYFNTEIKFNNLIHQLSTPQTIYLLAYRMILHDLKEDKPFHQPGDFSLEFSNQRQWLITRFENKLDSMLILSAYNKEDQYLDSILYVYDYDIKSINDNLKVWRSGATDFITIEYYSDSPLLSAFAVNMIVSEFLRFKKYSLYQQNKENIAFYKKLVSEAKHKVDTLQLRYNNIRRQNQIIDFKITSESKINILSALESSKDEIESRINAIELSITDLDNRINQISSGRKQSMDNQRLLQLKEQINTLNESYINSDMKNNNILDSLNDLRNEYVSEMTKVQNSELAGVDIELLKELQNKKFELETELKIAESNLGHVNNRKDQARMNVSSLASKESQLRELEQEIEPAYQEYLTLKDKLNDINNQALVIGNNLRQTQYGQPSLEPDSSKKIMLVVLGFLSGFIVSTFTIVGLELFDLSLRDPSRFHSIVKLPLIGNLSKINLKNYDFKFVFANKNSKNREFEYFRQSIRKIRFEIVRRGIKTILVNSLDNNEGKSFAILALAYSLNLINKKILIIDTNFKNNTLTKLQFQKRKMKGNDRIESSEKDKILNYVDDSADGYPYANSNQLIMKTEFSGIDMIGSHPTSKSPNEVFSNNQFSTYIKDYTNKYDIIFLEGPSINNYPDAKELIDYCDGLIAIFSAGKVLNKIDKESIEYYHSLNDKFLGSILNRVEISNLK